MKFQKFCHEKIINLVFFERKPNRKKILEFRKKCPLRGHLHMTSRLFFNIFDPLPPPCHPFYYIGLCTSVTFWRPPSPLRKPWRHIWMPPCCLWNKINRCWFSKEKEIPYMTLNMFASFLQVSILFEFLWRHRLLLKCAQQNYHLFSS